MILQLVGGVVVEVGWYRCRWLVVVVAALVGNVCWCGVVLDRGGGELTWSKVVIMVGINNLRSMSNNEHNPKSERQRVNFHVRYLKKFKENELHSKRKTNGYTLNVN